MVAEASTIHEFVPSVSDGDADLIVDDNEFLMSSESHRRTLLQEQRHISYGALRMNQIPCSSRGSSYYGCQQRGRANPYNRGCSVITHCARDTS
ncbi:RALF 19 [Spatholobus suberectus]|nr:RALF 19 [Spatholobus suberectus]